MAVRRFDLDDLERETSRVRACARRSGRGRGIGGGGRAGGGGSFWDPSIVPAADQLADWADQYTLDGGGRADPWIDSWVGFDLDIATASRHPAVTDPDADFNGEPSYTFAAANLTVLQAGAVGSFKPLHDGTGILVGGAVKPTGAAATQVLLCTHATGNPVGATIRRLANAVLGVIVANGSAQIISIATANGTFPDNEKSYFVWLWREDAGVNEYELWIWRASTGWVQRAAGTTSTAPSSADASAVLNVGRATTDTQFFEGKMARLLMMKDISKAAQLRAYLVRKYGG